MNALLSPANFCAHWPVMHLAYRSAWMQDALMDTVTEQDAFFLDAVEAVVMATLDRIGSEPGARFRFFKRILVAAAVAANTASAADHHTEQ